MKVLWLSPLPRAVEREALGNKPHGAQHDTPWILGHLPPPAGIELHLACLWPGGDHSKTIEYRGATIHLLPCMKKGRAMSLFLFDAGYFRPLVRALKPDVIHAWGTEDSLGLVATRLTAGQGIVNVQGLVNVIPLSRKRPGRRLVARFFERVTFKRAGTVIAETKFAAAHADRLGRRKNKTKVVEQPLRDSFLGQVPAEQSEKTVLFVGTLNRLKGIKDALEAFAAIMPDDWCLTVVGSGANWQEQELKDHAQRLRLGGRFVWHRSLTGDELKACMRTASILLLPTYIDSGPTVLKEALALGLWPVCYDNSGPGEYIRRYGFGSLACDRDLNDLKKVLGAVLESRPWLDINARNAVSKRVQGDMCREHAWSRLLPIYEDVAGATDG